MKRIRNSISKNVDAILDVFEHTDTRILIYYPKSETMYVPDFTVEHYHCRREYDNMPDSFIQDFVSEQDETLVRDLFFRAKMGENGVGGDIRNKNGTKVRLTLGTLEKSDNGKPLTCIGIIEDLSEMYKEEQLVEQLRLQLSLNDSRDEQINEAKEMISTAIGAQYQAVYQIRLADHHYVCFEEKIPGLLSIIGSEGNFESAWASYTEQIIAKEDHEKMHAFADLDTLAQRLKNNRMISEIYRRKDFGWTRGQFIVAKRDESGRVTHVIYTVSDINYEVEIEQDRSRAVYEAEHDPLTHVYNRKGFERLVKELSEQPLMVALIDIDYFKDMNDTYGHDTGDSILKEVAEAIVEELPIQGNIFRFGGDEFGVLIPGGTKDSWEEIRHGLERIHRRLEIRLSKTKGVTLSVGMSCSEKGYTPDLLLWADEALYETKRNGRAGCTLINAEQKILARWRDESAMDYSKNLQEHSSEGMFRMEFEDGKTPRMFADERTKQSMGVSIEASAEECYLIWTKGVLPGYTEALWKMRQTLIRGEQAECTYQWNHPVYGPVFVRSRGYGERRGNVEYLYGRHEVLNDTVIIEREDINKDIARALSGTYRSAYYINLNANTSQMVRDTIYTREMLAGIHDADASFRQFISVMVKPEYREKLRAFTDLSTLNERLKGRTHLDCEYNSTKENSRCRASFVSVHRDENEDLLDVLFLIEALGPASHKENHRLDRSDLILQQKAANLVTSSEVLSVSVIDALTGDVEVTSSSFTHGEQKVNVRDMEYYERYVAEADRDTYRKMLDIRYLEQQVENDGHFAATITVETGRGEIRHLTNHFTKLDNTSILSVVEDNTDTVNMDPLTDCMNKVGFIKRMMIYLPDAKPGSYAVLAFNVAKFKAINRQYGYEAGDDVLKEIVRRLNHSALLPSAVCHEMADSFFCLVRSEYISAKEIERLCHFSVTIGSEELQVAMNCGVYRISAADENVNVMLDKARMVCRESYRNVVACWLEYDEEQNSRYMDQAYIIRNVKHAIEADQFEVVYQPVFDAKTEKPVGAEGLVRWNHPKKGFISPALFLPAVEQSGYMLDLDKFVGMKVWMFIKNRLDCGKYTLPVTLNMSRFDFFQPESVTDMKTMLMEFPEMHKWIPIEITESGIEDIWKNAKELLDVLRQQNVKLLIDDFGSGYSSLGMLANFDCDIIKLDMSFIRNIGINPKAEKVIEGIINGVHGLGLKLIAEGVETKQQFEFLKERDCDYIQGYYFSKPLREAEFAALLDRNEEQSR